MPGELLVEVRTRRREPGRLEDPLGDAAVARARATSRRLGLGGLRCGPRGRQGRRRLRGERRGLRFRRARLGRLHRVHVADGERRCPQAAAGVVQRRRHAAGRRRHRLRRRHPVGAEGRPDAADQRHQRRGRRRCRADRAGRRTSTSSAPRARTSERSSNRSAPRWCRTGTAWPTGSGNCCPTASMRSSIWPAATGCARWQTCSPTGTS